MKILIFGNGYIGNRCKNAWSDAILSGKQILSKQDALEEIQKYQPDVVLNTVGVKGKPNVDWCETHPFETMRGNVLEPLVLADACAEVNIYLLHMGSGCIFYGDSPHPDKAWRENDFGNPIPVYSRSKWAADLVLSTLPNVGIARIRMPIDHEPAPGNLIDKLASYQKIIDVENSATVIDDMLQVFHLLLEKRAIGIFHVTNPGTIKHRQILTLYQKIVDPKFSCEWISNNALVEQGLAVKTRSNNFLSSERLAEFDIYMRPIEEAIEDTMKKYKKRKQGESIECNFCQLN